MELKKGSHDQHDEILEGFRHLAEARRMFNKYSGVWFSGNDNHIGDIGEYWAMLHFLPQTPSLAPKKTSLYDFQLNTGEKVSVKTKTPWNKFGTGSPVKGIHAKSWDLLVAVQLDEQLQVEKMCIIPHHIVSGKVEEGKPFKWWDWLEAYEVF